MSDISQSQTESTKLSATGLPDGSAGTKVIIRVGLMTIAVGIFAVWFWTGRPTATGLSVHSLPVLAEVPNFTLVSHTGQNVSLADLHGRVWVADFIFTTCNGPCPMLTLRMRSLQSALLKTGRPVKLVSITVDPETDTPAVLNRYAEKNHADAQRWWFLTGEPESVVLDLVQQGFLQAVAPSVDGRLLIHSTRFVLVDQKGRIRASYDGLEPTTKSRILHDIDLLISETTD